MVQRRDEATERAEKQFSKSAGEQSERAWSKLEDSLHKRIQHSRFLGTWEQWYACCNRITQEGPVVAPSIITIV